MTQLEKAARAMALKYYGEDVWPRVDPEQRRSMMDAARVAIEAVRDPTPDMRIAGGIAWAEAAAETYVDNADACFKAMIDAMLTEHPDG
jgi:hypothetical protein